MKRLQKPKRCPSLGMRPGSKHRRGRRRPSPGSPRAAFALGLNEISGVDPRGLGEGRAGAGGVSPPGCRWAQGCRSPPPRPPRPLVVGGRDGEVRVDEYKGLSRAQVYGQLLVAMPEVRVARHRAMVSRTARVRPLTIEPRLIVLVGHEAVGPESIGQVSTSGQSKPAPVDKSRESWPVPARAAML